ncbi:hypothetical protein IFM89_022455 [Coptis chinensis]|uniref:Uncharacterized protein n=1 Tax=Coptis chinensis TaxID=261450 RepID=A0A835IG99_9MAGN|nr:hypothetical protein IFM89_022455 [Coptis chinensis]
MSGWFSIMGQVLALSSVVTMVFLGYKCEAKCEFKAISNFGDSNSDNCRICFDDFLRRDMVEHQSHRNLLAMSAGIKQKENVDTIVQKVIRKAVSSP